MTLKRLNQLSTVLESVAIWTFLTTAILVRVIRAVADTVTFCIHLVDAFLVQTLEAEVRADTRCYSRVDTGPEIKTHRVAYFSHSVWALLSVTSKPQRNRWGLKMRLKYTVLNVWGTSTASIRCIDVGCGLISLFIHRSEHQKEMQECPPCLCNQVSGWKGNW